MADIPLLPRRVLAHATREWQRSAIVIVPRFLPQDTHIAQRIADELAVLEPHAESLTPNPHSRYWHLLPEFMARTPRHTLLPDDDDDAWDVLRVYEVPALEQLVAAATGWRTVHRLPLRADKRFEINGKINFYNADHASYLGWHFDRVDNYAGQQAVAVLTLRNDWDTQEEREPSLGYVPTEAGTLFPPQQQVYCGGGTLTLHDPDKVLHRVLPFQRSARVPNQQPWRRVVLVMRFTNDPTPVAHIGRRLSMWVRTAAGMVAVGDVQWTAVLAAVLLALVGIAFTIRMRVQGTRTKLIGSGITICGAAVFRATNSGSSGMSATTRRNGTTMGGSGFVSGGTDVNVWPVALPSMVAPALADANAAPLSCAVAS